MLWGARTVEEGPTGGRRLEVLVRPAGVQRHGDTHDGQAEGQPGHGHGGDLGHVLLVEELHVEV